MALIAAFSLNRHSIENPPFDEEAKNATSNKTRDDGDSPDGSDDDGEDDNDDSTTIISKTHNCVSSSSFPTYTISPLWLTASSASSSTTAKETLTAAVGLPTTAFACTLHASASASSTLFIIPTSAGLNSSSASPASTIVGKRPIRSTATFIMVPILATIIVLLMSLVAYLAFRIWRYRRERDADKTLSANEGRSNRQSSVCELDTSPTTQQRKTWYSRLRESFITPKAPVQNSTPHVNQVPDYDSYMIWAHRSSSVYSAAVMSDISSGYGTYGSQHALPIPNHSVRMEYTKSSLGY